MSIPKQERQSTKLRSIINPAAILPKTRGRRVIIIVSVVLLIFGLLLALLGVVFFTNEITRRPSTFVGIDIAYGGENDVYRIADAVSGYTNLIILGSTNVTQDSETLTRVCDYLYQKGLYFIIYVGFSKSLTSLPPAGPDSEFFTRNQNRWKDKLLGAYMFDEPGGKQLDLPDARPAPAADNNSDAAIHYILDIEQFLSLYKNDYYSVPRMRLFTSDYALYWYDYMCTYDVVFGELTESHNRQITTALCRGAARVMNKQWGTIITWSTPDQSFIDNATKLYDDMTFSWQQGANYIVVFDAPPNNSTATTPYGILTNDHLNAMKDFWNYARTNPQPAQNSVQTAYVLPLDYGYGFRGPNEPLWGLFPADSLTQTILNDTYSLLNQYNSKLDIIYEAKTNGIPANLTYPTLIFWNGTTIQQSQYK